MKSDADIIIVGGGLNGCTAALALAQIGQEVILIDAQPKKILAAPEFDGRGYALALTSKNMLSVLGIWPDVADNSCPMLNIKVSDGRAGEGAAPFFVHFDHTEIEEGPMGYMLEDRFLRMALLRAIKNNAAIKHLDQTTVVDQQIDTGGVSVELAGGETLTAKLLIGCDGRKSQVAVRAGIKRTGWDYNQTSLVCAIAHELPHNNTAHQFFMPSGPLAILPLNDNTSSIVWTETTKRAAEIAAMNDADYMECLRPCFGDFLGDISLKGGRFAYPLNLTLADRFVDHRLALVGDAAHGVHPLAGQGLNLGLRDIAALTEVLAKAMRRGEDIGALDVLTRFQQWRRFDTSSSVASTNTINKLFSNDNPFLRTVRDLGLGMVNSSPFARRGLMRQAAGLTGDLPKMLQGKMI
jgi:2-octaprenyl-6-methoxyphenol hydroxylase